MNKSVVCDMRGYLSFLVLWLLSKKPMSGAELAKEIERRKGCRPNPGTIYPALKELARKRAITTKNDGSKEKVYTITAMGRSQLEIATNSFCKTFYDVFTR